MQFFLSFVLPIILGAAIGYITNVLAIKMLFRPLKEVKIGSFTLPFTPGILPKNRHKLALSLAKAVSRELLSEEVLRERFASEEFKLILKEQVRKGFSEFLDVSISDLLVIKNNDLNLVFKSLTEEILQSSGFELLISTLINSSIDHVKKMPLSELVPNQLSYTIVSFLGSVLEKNQAGIQHDLDKIIDDLICKNSTVKDLLPTKISDFLEHALYLIYPEVFKALMLYVKGNKAKNFIHAKAILLVENTINKLNSMQKFFVSLGKYDRSIIEAMPEVVNDLIVEIEKEGIKERTRLDLVHEIVKEFNKILSMRISDAFLQYPSLRNQLHNLTHIVINTINKESVRILIANASNEAFLQKDGLNLEMLLSESNSESVEKFKENLCGFTVNLCKSFLIKDENNSLTNGIKEKLGTNTLSNFFQISPSLRTYAEDVVQVQLNALLEKKVSEIIKAVDIEKVVVERINALDMKDLEKIILDVMSEQFFWIDIFGGILGALIGLIQVLLFLLTRS